MATFAQEAVEFMPESEASTVVDTATSTGSAAIEHDVLIDSVQVLSLGGLTLDQVIGTGIALVKRAGGYKKGTQYDFFTTSQRDYGKHVAKMSAALKSTDTIVDSMVYKGNYSVARTSLTLISDLITPAFGDSYFEVEFENYLVSSGTVTTRNTDKSIGLRGAIELYVTNLESGHFYFLNGGKKVGVYLGDKLAYTTALNLIQAGDAVNQFAATLQTIPSGLARELRMQSKQGDAQYDAAKQKLFYNVFKAIKTALVPVVPAAQATN